MQREWPFIHWHIDINRYNIRPIKSTFHGASYELVVLILNFCLHRMLAIPMGQGRFTGTGISHDAARRAIDALKARGYIELALNYGTDIKRAKVYRRTAKFEAAFRVRVGKKLAVPERDLLSPRCLPPEDSVPIESVPGLSAYSALVKGARLTMSDGSDVTRRVLLALKGGMLYAYGDEPYQTLSGGDKGIRRLLLIDGLPTAELDFPAMHFNLLLNRQGLPSDELFYEHVLGELGVKPSKGARSALKLLALTSLNCGTFGRFKAACERSPRLRDDGGRRLMDVLGVRPKDIADAILEAYPCLKPHVCADADLWRWLQAEEGAIIADVLETLAKAGVVSLPEYDSVIVQSVHSDAARHAMQDCYKARTVFPIQVR